MMERARQAVEGFALGLACTFVGLFVGLLL